MATGAGLGGLMAALLPLIGVVTIWTARRRQRRGDRAPDVEFEKRQAAKHETERRMAAYLAGRDAGRSHSLADDMEQETRR